MNSLPVEMLKMIVDQVPAGEDLRNIRVSNIKNTRWHAEAFKNAVQSKAAIPYIKEIVFRDKYLGEDGTITITSLNKQVHTDSGYHAREYQESLSSTFSRLHELPALKTLVLLFLPIYPEEYLWEVLSGLSRSPPFTLTSLTITGLIAVHNELFDTLSFRALFERLTYLRVAVISGADFEEEPAYENMVGFWEKTISQRILEPRVSLAQSLTSLTIHSDQDVGFIPAIDLSQLTFSSLRYLSLRYILFDEVSMNVEDFIVRHGGTLKTLALQLCRIAVHHPEQGPTRFWSQIWNRFLAEMKALVNLEVVEEENRHDHPERVVRYLDYDDENGYGPIFAAVPDEEADVAALCALDVLLDSR